jgi:hypothetical protein
MEDLEEGWKEMEEEKYGKTEPGVKSNRTRRKTAWILKGISGVLWRLSRWVWKDPDWFMSNEDMLRITVELDDTTGFLIKDSTLKWLIERAVNDDRSQRGV